MALNGLWCRCAFKDQFIHSIHFVLEIVYNTTFKCSFMNDLYNIDLRVPLPHFIQNVLIKEKIKSGWHISLIFISELVNTCICKVQQYHHLYRKWC